MMDDDGPKKKRRKKLFFESIGDHLGTLVGVQMAPKKYIRPKLRLFSFFLIIKRNGYESIRTGLIELLRGYISIWALGPRGPWAQRRLIGLNEAPPASFFETSR